MPRVLLVEDDETMISLLETLLTMEGYQVEPIFPGIDIFQSIKSSKPDAVLLDVYLGKQNGIELLVDIRKDKELDEIRIIMTSGIDHSDECIRRGADEFLLKPFTPEELLNSLRSNSRKHSTKSIGP
jgi:DNA-binding response OmpR family regulator